MTLKEYLKILHPVFDEIAEKTGFLLARHAMNHEPTKEELQKMQSAMQEVADNLSEMSGQAQEQITEYSRQLEASYEKSKEMIEHLTELYAQSDQICKQQAEQEICLAEANRVALECKEMADRAREEWSNLESEKQKYTEKAKKQNKNLKKWCWVPGYNVYLAFDKLLNDYEARVKSARKKSEEKNREYVVKQENADREQKKVIELNRQKKEIDDRCSQLNQEIYALNTDIEAQKKQLIYWEDMKQRVSDLESKLSTGKASPDVLLEVLEMMNMFKEGIE